MQRLTQGSAAALDPVGRGETGNCGISQKSGPLVKGASSGMLMQDAAFLSIMEHLSWILRVLGGFAEQRLSIEDSDQKHNEGHQR